MIPEKKGNKVLLIWPETDKGYYDFNPLSRIFGNRGVFFPLPLLYVASALSDFWDYTIADENIKTISRDQAEQADFFMISSNILQRNSVEKLIKRLEPYNKPIIVGGPAVSTIPEAFVGKNVTKVIGEIESIEENSAPDTVAEILMRDMKNQCLRNSYKAHGHPDLKKALPPRYDLVKFNQYYHLSIQVSRGCNHSCDFCQEIFLYGIHQRKTTEQVINELTLLLKLGTKKTVFIVDDNFIGDLKNCTNKTNLIALLDSLYNWQKKYSFPFDFVTQCSLEIADHKEIVALMVKAGINMVFLGIETDDPATLASMHKSQNFNTNMFDAVTLLRNNGIGILGGLIIGFDNDTPESINHQYEFIQKTSIPYAGISLLQAPLGSKLHYRLQKEGRLSGDNNALTKSFCTNIITKMNPTVLYTNYLKLAKALYNPESYFHRSLEWCINWNDAFVVSGKKGSISANLSFLRLFRSVLFQGLASNYRTTYWKYLWIAFLKFKFNSNKMSVYLYLIYFYTIVFDIVDQLEKFEKHIPNDIIENWERYYHKKT